MYNCLAVEGPTPQIFPNSRSDFTLAQQKHIEALWGRGQEVQIKGHRDGAESLPLSLQSKEAWVEISRPRGLTDSGHGRAAAWCLRTDTGRPKSRRAMHLFQRERTGTTPHPALGKSSFQLWGGGGSMEFPKMGGFGIRAQSTGPLISFYELWRRKRVSIENGLFSPNTWQMMTC